MRVFGLLALAGAVLLLTAAGTASGSVALIITRDTFYSMLSQGHHGRGDGGCEGGAFYTYDAFVEAASTFRGFGTTGDLATRRRELAAFFAQTSHETTGYCWVKRRSPAGDQQYYGRGPMQLTHEHNYRRAGDALGLDLVGRPDLVSTDPVVAFRTAIWFWMTPARTPKRPSCHAVMTGGWRPSRRDRRAGRLPGYGMTTNIITGGLACGKRHGTPQGRDRVGYYKRYCRLLGVRLGRNVACINQKPYGHGAVAD